MSCLQFRNMSPRYIKISLRHISCLSFRAFWRHFKITHYQLRCSAQYGKCQMSHTSLMYKYVYWKYYIWFEKGFWQVLSCSYIDSIFNALLTIDKNLDLLIKFFNYLCLKFPNNNTIFFCLPINDCPGWVVIYEWNILPYIFKYHIQHGWCQLYHQESQ